MKLLGGGHNLFLFNFTSKSCVGWLLVIIRKKTAYFIYFFSNNDDDDVGDTNKFSSETIRPRQTNR